MASILNVDKIRRAAGNTDALVIDSGDRVTTPTRPFFRVSMVGTGGTGVSGHIIFNTVDTNQGSHWDATNGYFVAPVAGVYQFNFVSLQADSTSGSSINSGSDAECGIEVSTDSGSSYTRIGYSYTYCSNTFYYIPMNISVAVLLGAGNYVRVNFNEEYMYYNTVASGRAAHFSGYLVG